MPLRCPVCHDEYEHGVERCAACDVVLAASGADVPPRVDALLGTFHPAAAATVEALLTRRGIPHETLEVDGRVEVLVDRDWRDEIRAELIVNWSEIVAGMPPEERSEVLGSGGRQPGWFDPPAGAWVDRQGRIQVDPYAEEAAEADAQRRLGPGMVAAGTIALLLGWYAGADAWVFVLGIGAVLIGLFVPR